MEAKKYTLTPLCFQLLPGEIINGKYCECSNVDCPRDRDTGLICGGEKVDIYMHFGFLASVKCSKNGLQRRYRGAHWNFWHNARDTRGERNRKITPLVFLLFSARVSRALRQKLPNNACCAVYSKSVPFCKSNRWGNAIREIVSCCKYYGGHSARL